MSYILQDGHTALHVAVSKGNLEVAALIIDKTREQNELTIDMFDDISLKPAIRERLLIVFNKVMRNRHRLQASWMSSSSCTDDSNILSILPADLSRSVSSFF